MGRAQTASGDAAFPISVTLTREGADGQAVVCPLLRGSSPTRGVAPKQHRGPAICSSITLTREGADGQAVVCPLLRGSSPTRGVAPKQHRAAAFPISVTLTREGADGQAVVCPLLRGSSPTRGVAPKQHRGLRRAFSPAFRAGSLYPLARGCRRIWRGEGCNYDLWLRRRRQLRHDPIATARCCSTGSGPLDLDLLNLDLLISGPRVSLSCRPFAGARAVLARRGSARCYGVDRQREGSRQNSIGTRVSLSCHPY